MQILLLLPTQNSLIWEGYGGEAGLGQEDPPGTQRSAMESSSLPGLQTTAPPLVLWKAEQ